MNNLVILVSLSENDKRLLIALLLVLILVFVLIGYIGMLITRIMKWQGKMLDNLVADALYTRVVTTRKHFFKYANKKNWRMFYKQSWVGILIIIVSVLVLVIRNAIVKDFSYNPFNQENGFATVLFLWDFGNQDYYTTIFGIKVLSQWPGLINSPHFVLDAWASYVFVPGVIIGGLWYFWATQCFIARTIRMIRLSRTAFDKNLDNFNQNDAIANRLNNAVNGNPNPNNNNINQQ